MSGCSASCILFVMAGYSSLLSQTTRHAAFERQILEVALVGEFNRRPDAILASSFVRLAMETA